MDSRKIRKKIGDAKVILLFIALFLALFGVFVYMIFGAGNEILSKQNDFDWKMCLDFDDFVAEHELYVDCGNYILIKGVSSQCEKVREGRAFVRCEIENSDGTQSASLLVRGVGVCSGRFSIDECKVFHGCIELGLSQCNTDPRCEIQKGFSDIHGAVSDACVMRAM